VSRLRRGDCWTVGVLWCCLGRWSVAIGAEAALQGKLQNAALTESSGLAASRQNPGVLWTLNDSGNDPQVFAIGEHGEDLATYRVLGVGRGDWEDIGTARLDGTDVLVIADIGDNLHRRTQRALHLVPEPSVDAGRRGVRGELRPLRTIRFRYPDTAHDCEAVAVEPDAKRALLVAKTWWGGAPVFSVSLTAGTRVRVAEPVGSIPVSWATAGSMSVDGRRLLVGTYGAAYVYRRGVGEPWAAALGRSPERIALPARPQGEGSAFSTDGRSIFACSEGAHSGLWRVPIAVP
jgi:hypothetical protein